MQNRKPSKWHIYGYDNKSTADHSKLQKSKQTLIYSKVHSFRRTAMASITRRFVIIITYLVFAIVAHSSS